MWIFSYTEKRVKEEEKKWNNDEKPTHESVLWRFRTLKNIRERNVPKLRKVKFEKKLEIIPVSYKRGTTELYEKQISPISSPSLCMNDNEYENLRPQQKRKRKKKRNKSNF
jgi:hypothetical protein